uniref:Uncharacterized protein n=1 Tax=Clastoptera arizonana TaxID=38151 RepID=A0A1B6E084_9HEMI
MKSGVRSDECLMLAKFIDSNSRLILLSSAVARLYLKWIQFYSVIKFLLKVAPRKEYWMNGSQYEGHTALSNVMSAQSRNVIWQHSRLYKRPSANFRGPSYKTC